MNYRLNRDLFVRTLTELTPTEVAFWDERISCEPASRRAFMSRAFCSACQDAGMKVIALVAYALGKPVLLLPLQRKAGVAGSLGVFEPVGGVMADYFGVLAESGTMADVADLLTASRCVGAVLYTHLDETQAQYGLRIENARTGLRTRIPSDMPYWDFLRKSDRKLVGDTDRRQRKLEQDHGANLQFQWTSETPSSDLEWLISNKRKQYSTTGRESAPLFDSQNVKLLEALLRSNDSRCAGILSVLRCADRIVAAHLGLRCHDVLHVWFPVYDAEFAQYSPGRLLFKHMFCAAAENGIALFDRGEGDTQAKRDFANETHQFGSGVWRAGTIRGTVARAAISVGWRLASVR